MQIEMKRKPFISDRQMAVVMLAAAIPAGVVILCGASAAGAAADTPQETYYTTKVQPIMAGHCTGCHNTMKHRGGLDLTTSAGIMKGGKDGVVIVPGDPENSLLVKLIRQVGVVDDPGPMPPPPNHAKLSDDDIATIVQWIKDGAAIPADAAPTAVPAAK
jgi:mono/diheme cytochrome c family protein